MEILDGNHLMGFDYLQEMVEFTPVQVWDRHPGEVTEGL